MKTNYEFLTVLLTNLLGAKATSIHIHFDGSTLEIIDNGYLLESSAPEMLFVRLPGEFFAMFGHVSVESANRKVECRTEHFSQYYSDDKVKPENDEHIYQSHSGINRYTRIVLSDFRHDQYRKLSKGRLMRSLTAIAKPLPVAVHFNNSQLCDEQVRYSTSFFGSLFSPSAFA